MLSQYKTASMLFACTIFVSSATGQSANHRGYATSSGTDSFGILVLNTGDGIPAEGGGDIFFNTMDWDPQSQKILGVSWDELYKIDPTSGETERLGPIRNFDVYRTTLNDPASWPTFLSMDTPDAEQISFSLELEVKFHTYDNGELVVYSQNTFQGTCSREAPYSSESIEFLTGSFHDITTNGDEASATLSATAHFSGSTAWVTFDNSASVLGTGDISISGILRRYNQYTPHTTTSTLLPMRGITVSPTGTIVGLSEEWLDFSGYPSLYKLMPFDSAYDPETNEPIPGSQYVEAQLLVNLNTMGIESIEWATSPISADTLYGYGNGTVYSIDIESGTCEQVLSTSFPIADLDCTSTGLLRGLEYVEAGTPQIKGVNHPYSVNACSGDCGPMWGLSSLSVTRADMDLDWDVDLNDYIQLSDCLEGPSATVPSNCSQADINQDGTIDLQDFSIFQAAY